MRRPIVAAVLGALAGVSVAGSVRLADEYFEYLPWSGYRTLSIHPSPIDVLLTTAGAAGPGAFVLGYALSLLLRARAEGGASRGRVLALGTLLGLPAGILNLFTLMLLLGGAREIPRLILFADPVYKIIVAAALAGGAALGLVCAWALTRPPRKEAA